MSYFPVVIQLENKKCVVVGGGQVAYNKALSLLEAGGLVTVVAPEIQGKFRELEKQIGSRLKFVNREVREKDLLEATLVVAATNQESVNQEVVNLCETAGIIVNNAGCKSNQGVQFTSIVRRGPITIGISTGGTSPLLAKKIKKMVEDSMPNYMGELALNLQQSRAYIIQNIQNQDQRKEAFSRLLEIAISNEGCISSGDVEDLVLTLIGGEAYDKN